MSNVTKKAIVRALVEGTLTDLMVKTQADNVYLDGETTVAAKLAELVAAVNLRAKSEDVTAAISAAISGLVDGAPETYNTLKEIADYIAAHQEVSDALDAAIGAKADKSALEAVKATVEALGALAGKDKIAEADLDAALAAKLNSSHSHANSAVLDGITAEKTAAWDAKSRIYCSAAQPAGLAAGDLWLQTVE